MTSPPGHQVGTRQACSGRRRAARLLRRSQTIRPSRRVGLPSVSPLRHQVHQSQTLPGVRSELPKREAHREAASLLTYSEPTNPTIRSHSGSLVKRSSTSPCHSGRPADDAISLAATFRAPSRKVARVVRRQKSRDSPLRTADSTAARSTTYCHSADPSSSISTPFTAMSASSTETGGETPAASSSLGRRDCRSRPVRPLDCVTQQDSWGTVQR